MQQENIYEAGLVLTVAAWLKMARTKHAWPDEADGTPQAYGALSSEMRELRRAVDHRHPDEHVISELLDVIAVALRMLDGEHLRDEEERRTWLDLALGARPTKPGEIGPWDEHKGGM